MWLPQVSKIDSAEVMVMIIVRTGIAGHVAATVSLYLVKMMRRLLLESGSIIWKVMSSQVLPYLISR